MPTLTAVTERRGRQASLASAFSGFTAREGIAEDELLLSTPEPCRFLQGALAQRPPRCDSPKRCATKGSLVAVWEADPIPGKQTPSSALLQLPRLRHSVSWQQVQLGPLTRSWREGALSSTFHVRKSRHFAGIFGSPEPSPRPVYAVLWAGQGGRREEDGFLKDSRSKPSPETGMNEI